MFLYLLTKNSYNILVSCDDWLRCSGVTGVGQQGMAAAEKCFLAAAVQKSPHQEG